MYPAPPVTRMRIWRQSLTRSRATIRESAVVPFFSRRKVFWQLALKQIVEASSAEPETARWQVVGVGPHDKLNKERQQDGRRRAASAAKRLLHSRRNTRTRPPGTRVGRRNASQSGPAETHPRDS